MSSSLTRRVSNGAALLCHRLGNPQGNPALRAGCARTFPPDAPPQHHVPVAPHPGPVTAVARNLAPALDAQGRFARSDPSHRATPTPAVVDRAKEAVAVRRHIAVVTTPCVPTFSGFDDTHSRRGGLDLAAVPLCGTMRSRRWVSPCVWVVCVALLLLGESGSTPRQWVRGIAPDNQPKEQQT